MSVRAKKSLGQNFLHDHIVIERIVDSLDLSADDTVIEIGPGLGALTSELVERAGNVIAIEFDRDMVAHLNASLNRSPNLQIIDADALTFDFSTVVMNGKHAKLIANLPYNISTPILQKLIQERDLFSVLVLMFQKEVVDRIAAGPGGKERGYLSVLVENAFDVEKLFDVPPLAFKPVPKVDSAVVRLTPKPSLIEHVSLQKVLSVAFAQKRKTILNNLKILIPKAAAKLQQCDIDPVRRAETLTLTEWKVLVDEIGGKI